MANIGNGLPYVASGFRLDGSVAEGDVFWYTQAISITITAGDALKFVSGEVTNASFTQFAATFAGVALITQTSSATTAAFTIPVIKPNAQKLFWVPVGSAVLVTLAAVGTVVDLKTNHSIDLTDTTLSSWGFEIVDIDLSTLAIAANSTGFVKGRFMPQPQ